MTILAFLNEGKENIVFASAKEKVFLKEFWWLENTDWHGRHCLQN